jgi:hypothetical protein
MKPFEEMRKTLLRLVIVNASNRLALEKMRQAVLRLAEKGKRRFPFPSRSHLFQSWTSDKEFGPSK